MRAKDKNYVPSNNSIRQIGDDRIIDYWTSPEYTKGYAILKVEDISEPIVSLGKTTSAKNIVFRIVCSDQKLNSIKEEFEKIEEEQRKNNLEEMMRDANKIRWDQHLYIKED